MENRECAPCTCSPESEEDSLLTSSLDIPPWLQSNGNPTHVKSSENGRQTDGSPTCKYGRGMSDCSIHPSTPAEWIASMRDSLVRTLVLLESRQDLLKEPDRGFTEKSCVLLGLLDHDTSSWRMWPLLPQKVLTKLSKTWSKWGMTVDGVAYAHPMWERRINVTDGGGYSLPTPTVAMEAPNKNANTKGPKNLVEVAQGKWNHLWPTPRNCSSLSATLSPKLAAHKYPNLETVVARTIWPTPVMSMSKGSSPASLTRKSGADRSSDRLDHAVMATDGGQLNPPWVEWLMGFPIGFTASKDWVTHKSRSKQRSRSKFSAKVGSTDENCI